jgi:hypothetical protein
MSIRKLTDLAVSAFQRESGAIVEGGGAGHDLSPVVKSASPPSATKKEKKEKKHTYHMVERTHDSCNLSFFGLVEGGELEAAMV